MFVGWQAHLVFFFNPVAISTLKISWDPVLANQIDPDLFDSLNPMCRNIKSTKLEIVYVYLFHYKVYYKTHLKNFVVRLLFMKIK